MKRIKKYFRFCLISCACLMTAVYSWSQDNKPLPQLPPATTFLPANPVDKVIEEVIIITAPLRLVPQEQQEKLDNSHNID